MHDAAAVKTPYTLLYEIYVDTTITGIFCLAQYSGFTVVATDLDRSTNKDLLECFLTKQLLINGNGDLCGCGYWCYETAVLA